MLQFNPIIEEFRKTISDLLGFTQTKAGDIKLISLEKDRNQQYNGWFFGNGGAQIRGYSKSDQDRLLNAATAVATHIQGRRDDGQQSCLRIARYMGAKRIVLNSLNHMYRAAIIDEPQQYFENYFRINLSPGSARGDFITALRAAPQQMLISIVQTMHPTIYHSAFGRERETELTDILERIAKAKKLKIRIQEITDSGSTIDAPTRQNMEAELAALEAGAIEAGKKQRIPNSYQPARTQDIATDIQSLIDNQYSAAQRSIETLVTGMAGKDPDHKGEFLQVTPDRQVTVKEENDLDHEDHLKMQKHFKEVVDAYNAALDTVAGERLLDGENISMLKINTDKIEYRTWAFAADADGRDMATSIELYRGLYYQIDPEKLADYMQHNPDRLSELYKSRTRDMRDNSKEHLAAASCLVQTAFRLENEFKRNGTKELAGYAGFQEFCKRFVKQQNEETASEPPDSEWNKGRTTWDKTGTYLFQQMPQEQRVEFLKQLITNGTANNPVMAQTSLLPPVIKEETVQFNDMFVNLYPEFLAKRGLPPDTDLDSFKKGGKNHDAHFDALNREVEAHPITLYPHSPNEETVQFYLNKDMLTYARTGENTPNKAPHSNLFITCKTADKQMDANGRVSYGSARDLDFKERRKLLDAIKRLQVIDDTIGKFGSKVADRYQIANFEGAEDFYSIMLLFKEVGLLEIEGVGEDARVKANPKPKLSIQPLLETAKDQAGAAALFTTLLKDPLVRSYYKELGHAEIMFGYSDGAKSAGNFASEWSIYQNARKLQQVFETAASEYDDLKGVKLRVFHGRGRGDSRGGQFDVGKDQLMMDPNLANQMIFDETLQSDLPLAGAISSSFGKDMCANIIAGIVTAKTQALQALRTLPDQNQSEAITAIADNARNLYCSLVGKKTPDAKTSNENVLKLLRIIPDNPYKSSRAAKRNINATSLDDIRAITVEYGFNMIDAPLHYIGLGTALQQYIDATGGGEIGRAQLVKLYQTHPFMHGIIEKSFQGLSDYDPNVFRLYAQAAGVDPNWLSACINELNRTLDLVSVLHGKRITTGQALQQRRGLLDRRVAMADLLEHQLNELRQEETDLDKNAHAMVLSRITNKQGIQVVKNPEKNPLDPSKDDDAAGAEIVRLSTFVNQSSLPNKMLRPTRDIRLEVVGIGA